MMNAKTSDVLEEVLLERERQDAKWGVQSHPSGAPDGWDEAALKAARAHYELCAKAGELTWRHILDEEVAEAYAALTPAELRAELLQCAAVCVAWVECLDRKEQS